MIPCRQCGHTAASARDARSRSKIRVFHKIKAPRHPGGASPDAAAIRADPRSFASGSGWTGPTITTDNRGSVGTRLGARAAGVRAPRKLLPAGVTPDRLCFRRETIENGSVCPPLRAPYLGSAAAGPVPPQGRSRCPHRLPRRSAEGESQR